MICPPYLTILLVVSQKVFNTVLLFHDRGKPCYNSGLLTSLTKAIHEHELVCQSKECLYSLKVPS